jgi:hypothetical protein
VASFHGCPGILISYGSAGGVAVRRDATRPPGRPGRVPGDAHARTSLISLPVLTVRGISDKADGFKHTTDGEGWQPIAAARAAAFARALAAEILNLDGPDRSDFGGTETRQTHPGGRQDVVAHDGGIAYGVLSGNMYVNNPTMPARPPRRPRPRAAFPDRAEGADDEN